MIRAEVGMTTTHGASASAVGYAYQTAWALFELLRRGPDMPDASISIELHDDVAWDVDGTPTERLQMKHHLNGAASISDMGSDLWRTVNVWLDSAMSSDVNRDILVLVTTATAPADSGVFRLRPDSRDEGEAVSLIEKAARESSSVSTAEARRRFLELSTSDRLAFVSRIFVLDGASSIGDLDAAVSRELTWSIPRGRDAMFMEMLWGWWNGEVLLQMLGRRGPIGVGELHLQISEIRDQFTIDRLPTLLSLGDVDREQVTALLGDRTFVKQLQLIDWPEHNLQRAVIDYHRAFVHTTRWLDDDLIGLPELLTFGLELVDEWKSEFEFMTEELPQPATEAELKAAGVALLRRLLSSSTIRVRPRYDDFFFARGKRHELADEEQVWWHPNYQSASSAASFTATAGPT